MYAEYINCPLKKGVVPARAARTRNTKLSQKVLHHVCVQRVVQDTIIVYTVKQLYTRKGIEMSTSIHLQLTNGTQDLLHILLPEPCDPRCAFE